MNRRGFLKLFSGAATAAAVAPTYFFAPAGGWKPVDRSLPRYSFSNINGIYAADMNLVIATGIDLDAIGRITGFYRRPPMYSERGLIIQNPESDHELRARIVDELAQRRYATI